MAAERDLYRGYDVRGIAGIDLTPGLASSLGRAFAAYARGSSVPRVYIGNDGRPSGAALYEGAIGGLVDGGAEVVELGVVPTPLVYFASARDAGSYGVSVTASHLAAEWNGLKFCSGSVPIHTDRIREHLGVAGSPGMSQGHRRPGRDAVLAAYREMLVAVGGDPGADAAEPAFGVVVDAQNAAASEIAPSVLRAMGLRVRAIHADPDAGYPFGTPDPQVAAHLEPLRAAVLEERARIGVAFDGDADRLGVVDERGRRLSSDVVLALFARDVVARSAGAAVVYDVLCSPVVEAVARAGGGHGVEVRSGHAYVQDAIREVAAPIGGEGSGHLFFADGYRGAVLGYDDAIYAAVRLIELARRCGPLGELADSLPEVVAGEEWRPPCPDNVKRLIVADFERDCREAGYVLSTVDGVKVEIGPLGWVLVRAANTEPALSVRVVGPTAAEVARVEQSTATTLRAIAARYDVTV